MNGTLAAEADETSALPANGSTDNFAEALPDGTMRSQKGPGPTLNMKVCSICNRQYADSLKFCLDDGTVLSPLPAPPATLVDPQATLKLSKRETESEPAPAPSPARARPMKILWLVLGVIVLAAFVVVVVAVLLLYQFRPNPASKPLDVNVASPAATSSTPSTREVEQEIERVNTEIGSAMVHGDPDTLARLLADDYRYVSDVGLTLNKLEVLALIRTGNLSYEYLNTTDPKIEVSSELNKAVLSAQAQSKGQMRRQAFTDSYFYRNTYEKRNGRWQLVSGTAWHRQ